LFAHMPHPVTLSLAESDREGLLIFGVCAVVTVAVIVIEEWPAIKETYQEVRSRRRQRRRMQVEPHQREDTGEETMMASGIQESSREMTMRARNVTHNFIRLWQDTKTGIQVVRPFAKNATNTINESASTGELLIPVQRDDSPTRFPIFEEDVSPLIIRGTSPFKALVPKSSEAPFADPIVPSESVNTVVAELDNPLDRPSSPELRNPFEDAEEEQSELHVAEPVAEPAESIHEDLEDIPLSRTSSHTFFSAAEDDGSMSDWTEAFDNRSESGAGSDVDSDSDVISDAESEASWARIRSRGVGVN
jgi:hypothetical protein